MRKMARNKCQSPLSTYTARSASIKTASHPKTPAAVWELLSMLPEIQFLQCPTPNTREILRPESKLGFSHMAHEAKKILLVDLNDSRRDSRIMLLESAVHENERAEA
jgi:hypothetical protein